MKPIKNKKHSLGKFAVAPYNFVSFPNKAVVKYKDIKELPHHNNFKDRNNDKLISGYIEYTLRLKHL